MLAARWPIIRDISLFVSGIAGVAHETLLAPTERPTLLILFAAMMGLPAFLRPTGGPEVSPEVGRAREQTEYDTTIRELLEASIEAAAEAKEKKGDTA